MKGHPKRANQPLRSGKTLGPSKHQPLRPGGRGLSSSLLMPKLEPLVNTLFPGDIVHISILPFKNLIMSRDKGENGFIFSDHENRLLRAHGPCRWGNSLFCVFLEGFSRVYARATGTGLKILNRFRRIQKTSGIKASSGTTPRLIIYTSRSGLRVNGMCWSCCPPLQNGAQYH